MDANDVIDSVVEQLRNVEGIRAVVLGGSRARGTETPESDIDIGLYYRSGYPIDTDALDRLASAIDDERRSGRITPLGGWGPWINGGGWLKVGGFSLDFLYRDTEIVTGVINDCRQGRIDIHYQPGHPHGFCTSIYMGEAAYCRPLWDPHGLVAEMKMLTDPYPATLRKATISKFMWEAEFSVSNAKKAMSRKDVSYAAGHLFRTVSCLAQVLFACNGVYLLNEKGAVAQCSRFQLAPTDFELRVREGFACLSAECSNLSKAISLFDALVRETAEIAL
ncbi:nucleotidyltransferase domain-containing protein [Paenibacillus sp. Soil724D2]|uniref:nucleotidyltransferase domain-containing protein n=1 Tax=Paenibacillus sp. (strain Soil724D2) TaxID=1736392 RepID=UPI000713BDD2|nr:nucleotidyltransferase domain-containing protein [Paenibacillus sp. Soil724D2]KRE52136.1 DNA polymerase subunit beta [Paenibacillus sp. Soil724D2]